MRCSTSSYIAWIVFLEGEVGKVHNNKQCRIRGYITAESPVERQHERMDLFYNVLKTLTHLALYYCPLW